MKNLIYIIHRFRVILSALFNQSFFLCLCILIAPVSILYKKIFLKKEIWLIGENEGECLQDNGLVFFRYCQKNQDCDSIYFIANRAKIRHIPYLRDNKNVLPYRGVRHIFFFLLADTLVFSHSHSDIAYISIVKLFKPHCARIFLQHGITAFKQVHSIYRTGHNEMDIFIVSSEFEKNLVHKNFTIPDGVIKVTGFARYDLLSVEKKGCNNTILYLPTWRPWVFNKSNAKDFIKGINVFLNNRSLIRLLSMNNVQLIFCMHNNMTRYMDALHVPEQIQIISPKNGNIQNLLIESSLLVTDYSSVAWDFYYQKKPVVFYQFDQGRYLEKQGSYIDFKTDLFGELFLNSESLVEGLKKYVLNSFEELPQFRKRRSELFAYKDRNNCRRIFDIIKTYKAEEEL